MSLEEAVPLALDRSIAPTMRSWIPLTGEPRQRREAESFRAPRPRFAASLKEFLPDVVNYDGMQPRGDLDDLLRARGGSRLPGSTMRQPRTSLLHGRPHRRTRTPVELLAARFVAPYASFAEIYDFLIEAPALPLLQAALHRSARQFRLNFRSLADVGCGTGAFLATLACRPISLTGIDCSASMLAIARRRLAPCPVTLLQQDFRRLNLPNPVDLITCHNQTINYLTRPEELVRMFSAIAHNLRQGGALVFDFIARARRRSRGHAAHILETIRLPDHDVRFEGVVDIACGRSTVRIDIATARAPVRRSVEVHRQRWFSPAMIRRCLRAAGLRLLCMRPIRGADNHWLHVVANRI